MEIIGEIGETLSYPRLGNIYSEAGVSRQDLLEAILRVARVIEVDNSVGVVNEDPTDDKFIECALAGKADYVVTGDHHLLELGSYQDFKIIRVSEFLQISNQST